MKINFNLSSILSRGKRPSREKSFPIPYAIGILALVLIPSLLACGGKSRQAQTTEATEGTGSAETQTLETDKEKEGPIMVFLGDSLTEGYRVAVEDNYPSRVGRKLADRGMVIEVVNGGLSGDTTAGGLERLDWFLRLQPDYLFLSLGSNDGLRGLELEQTYDNLAAIIERCQEKGVKVFLAGLKLPPNYGKEYVGRFEAIYPRLAQTYNLPLYPFLLEGVAGEKNLNLEDGIHPNPDGYEIISEGLSAFIAQNLK